MCIYNIYIYMYILYYMYHAYKSIFFPVLKMQQKQRVLQVLRLPQTLAVDEAETRLVLGTISLLVNKHSYGQSPFSVGKSTN